MIWPGLVFNLCIGLLFAGYLLRAVRRFERRVDAIIAKLDESDAESQRKYDAARDEIRDSMRAQVDRAIADMVSRSVNTLPFLTQQAAIVSRSRVALGGTVTVTEPLYVPPLISDQLPTEDEIAKLPRWARVAFAARCARRVLPLLKITWPDAAEEHIVEVSQTVDVAESSAGFGKTDVDIEWVLLGSRVAAGHASASLTVSPNIAVVVINAARVAASAAQTGLSSEVENRYAATADDLAAGAADTVPSAVSAFRHRVRCDFDQLAKLAEWQKWTNDTPVPPSVFGPLWPDGPPAGWPKPEKPVTEIVFEFDVPGDMTTAEAVDIAKELSAALCSLDLAGGGHGLAIQPPLEITAPMPVPTGSSV